MYIIPIMMKMLRALIIFAFLHVLDVSALPNLSNLLPRIGHHNNPLRAMYKTLAAAKPKAYLDAHNVFRQKMGMPPLQWDTKLETYARMFAAIRSRDCRLKHSTGPFGENIAWEQYAQTTPAQFVKRFTDEQVNYDLQRGVCNCKPMSSTCMCGHFTQVIWKTTKRVGCAESTCIGEKGKLVVCLYDPRGNILGRNPLNP